MTFGVFSGLGDDGGDGSTSGHSRRSVEAVFVAVVNGVRCEGTNRPFFDRAFGATEIKSHR